MSDIRLLKRLYREFLPRHHGTRLEDKCFVVVALLLLSLSACVQTEDYTVRDVASPSSDVTVGDPISWGLRGKPLNQGWILMMPDCESCLAARLDVRDWRRFLSRPNVTVAGSKQAEGFRKQLTPIVSTAKIRFGDDAPKIGSLIPGSLLLIRFDENTKVAEVVYDFSSINQRMRS